MNLKVGSVGACGMVIFRSEPAQRGALMNKGIIGFYKMQEISFLAE
jgi:hypothetical protein